MPGRQRLDPNPDPDPTTDLNPNPNSKGDPRWPDFNWSPRGHVVLDVGAHIGAFSVWCMEQGAATVTAYEPEPGNLALLTANLERFGDAAQVRAAAVSQPEDGEDEAMLVLGRDTQGVANTWRHALEGLSHYQESGGALKKLPVPLVPFFGAALGHNVTFVKLDCEGAELAILLMDAADWGAVERLVFEYSFTKERRMGVFRGVIERLRQHGFTVMYHGLGVWEALPEWPWHTDALVYCAREAPAGSAR